MQRHRLGIALMVDGLPGVEIEGIRRSLGSVGVRAIDPHITVVPPLNASSEDAMDIMANVAKVVGSLLPFAVEVGAPSTFSEDSPVLFLPISDVEGSVETLRERVLASGAYRTQDRPFIPHITVADGLAPSRVSEAIDLLHSYRSTLQLRRLSILNKPETPKGSRWREVLSVALGEQRTLPTALGQVSLCIEIGTSPLSRQHILAGGQAEEMVVGASTLLRSDPLERVGAVAHLRGREIGSVSALRRAGALYGVTTLVVNHEEMRGVRVGVSLLRHLASYVEDRLGGALILEDGELAHYAEHVGMRSIVLPGWLYEVVGGVAPQGMSAKLWSFSRR